MSNAKSLPDFLAEEPVTPVVPVVPTVPEAPAPVVPTVPEAPAPEEPYQPSPIERHLVEPRRACPASRPSGGGVTPRF
jgi:hypothetical protein